MPFSAEQRAAPHTVSNPYLEAYRAALAHERSCRHCRGPFAPGGEPARPGGSATCPRAPAGRSVLTGRYAFPVLDEHAIAEISALSDAMGSEGVVEVGAGTGYVCWLLAQAGLRAHAYDLYPPRSGENRWHTGTHHPVHAAGPEVLRDYADFALLLCWPPFEDPMARRCLRHYDGESLIYIGEGESSGCNADSPFFEELDRGWRLHRQIEIPTWDAIHDSLRIYHRERGR